MIYSINYNIVNISSIITWWSYLRWYAALIITYWSYLRWYATSMYLPASFILYWCHKKGTTFTAFVRLKRSVYPDSKARWAHVGPVWSRQNPRWAYVGPMKFAVVVMTAILLWIIENNGDRNYSYCQTCCMIYSLWHIWLNYMCQIIIYESNHLCDYLGMYAPMTYLHV